MRGRDVYIVQSIGENVNDALFELQLMAYACKTAAAHSIIGVIPYLPYSRQVLHCFSYIVCIFKSVQNEKKGFNCGEVDGTEFIQGRILSHYYTGSTSEGNTGIF